MTDRPAEDPEDPRTLDQSVSDLLDRSDTTTLAVQALTRAVDQQARVQRRLIWAAVVVLVAIGLVLLDNHRAIRLLQDRLCPIVTLSIHRPGEDAPVTPRGQDMEREARKLAGPFGCTLPAAAPNGR